ncbi:hypothetical protein DFQ28_010431 [Apophysomyces sp. BC1034]|nr:hypothetical protein DFQ30_008129 [Apophysomyces sp. BC1015]KAG0182264.1 hypothetical protein DFQ29_005147 [Apophysomyces sp. BC1021]KAG0184819.1 hypothetical protein DFQ28_010431 [Apophysomyces sp. BC1034]
MTEHRPLQKRTSIDKSYTKENSFRPDYLTPSNVNSIPKHQSDFELEFVNEEHVADFMRALAYDPLSGSESSAEHIAASSELIPRQRKKKAKKKQEQETGAPKGISQTLLRYPLMLAIGATILIELLLYISLRQIVRAWENFFSWRGKRRRLRNDLRAATSYKEWCRAADALDKYMHKDTWKLSDAYGFYDYRLIQKVITHLRMYRESDDPEDALNLKDVLYACLKQNFAGIENAKLYSNSYLGTKKLVEDYVNEVTRSIEALAESPHIPAEDKRLAFKLYSKNYGRTAFCLSGGAGFGYFHLGVIRALLDRKLLPSIITGTSAGSLMGAMVCTRTDEELREILVPELEQKINICQGSFLSKVVRYAKTGAFFDAEQWCREAMWFTRGSLTFKEAYERTGRIFNVSVIPYDPHSPPKLLNYITAPHCVIWSAIIASAAIPGVLNPVVLMQKKLKSDRLVPYNYGHKFKDGSLRTDIPTQALHNQFNVNYTVVSQVNPHIHVFFYANQGSPGRPVTHRYGKGWRGGFLASTAEQLLKLDLSKWLKVLRDLDLLPKLLDQDWSSTFLQKFDGTVTILPRAGLSDWLYIVADPDSARLQKLFRSGELQAWPKVSMVSNRMRIESSIQLARKAVRETQKANKRQLSTDVDTYYHQEREAANASDDTSGSSDEKIFLAGSRRASMANGGDLVAESELEKEERKRRRFVAQFSDRRAIMDGKEITAQLMQERATEDTEDDEDEDLV